MTYQHDPAMSVRSIQPYDSSCEGDSLFQHRMFPIVRFVVDFRREFSVLYGAQPVAERQHAFPAGPDPMPKHEKIPQRGAHVVVFSFGASAGGGVVASFGFQTAATSTRPPRAYTELRKP